jgi:D-glycero-D-manno-heptose 1,7-bisphosphate phosphatase
MRRAFFLDRDGVVNKSLVVNGLPRPPRGINEIEILPGVKEAINILVKFEFEVVVVTNQPDVARGNQSKTNVELKNSTLLYMLPR